MSPGSGPDAPSKSDFWDRLSRKQQIGALVGAGVIVLVAFGVVGSIAPAEEPADDSSSGSSEAPSQQAEEDDEEERAEPETEARECEEYTDVTSEQPLCDYEDAASYQYRLRLARNIDTVLPAVQAEAPWTEATDLTDLYGACDDITRELPAADVTANAVTRFSAGPDQQVTPDAADRLVDIARSEICPNA